MKPTHYNQIAGQSLERISALSDGIFSVAMTLLVLDLHLPSINLIHSENELCHALLALLPQLGVLAMSLLTLGIFWIGQQTQFSQFKKMDRNLAWVQIVFLFAVLIMPFSTKLLAEFITYRLAFAIYWVNMLALGILVFTSWHYANIHGLVKADLPKDINTAVRRRIIIGQSLYAFGALLCLVNTYLSLGFLLLVQLNYAIAPKFGRFLA